MMPYLMVAVTPLVISIFYGIVYRKEYIIIDETIRKKHKIHFLIASGTIIFLFLALRSHYIGSTDTENYYYMMRKAINTFSFNKYYNPEGVEFGFQLFVFGLSRILHNPQWLLVITSAIYVISISYFVYRNSDDIVMSLVMYVALDLMRFQMQGMRQAVAMSICFFAYEFMKKKKPITFFLLVLLACQLHRTAIVFSAVYFIRWLKYDIKSIFIVVFGSAVVFYFSDSIISTANEMFETSYYGGVESGGFVAVAIYLLIILAAFLFNRKLKNEQSEVMLFYLTIIGGICYLLRYIGTMLAERISFYFVFVQLALLPNTLSQLSEKEKHVAKFVVYLLMIALCMYRLRGSDLIPYQFFWE